MRTSLARNSPSVGALSRSLPRRGVEEFYSGSYVDPSVTAKEKLANARSGDAWPAALLRMKSFDDLHKLWYVLLKEKNFLMSERNAYWQYQVTQPNHGRLKKVKLGMKRLLTVLARREIHQQCLRAKEILKKQELREQLETQRFKLEEQIKQLRHKIDRLGPEDSLQKIGWEQSLMQHEADREGLLLQLRPLRKETMQLLVPDWRLQKKYSDLPGPVNWKHERVRALALRNKSFVRQY
uniref:Large ribosomal subunit protein uL29m n=1 Tax=Chromera velia CCMP2878 TaxID=1169474 RepID=A0A0G4G4L1_9ALVE|mmetsp:Transcript_47109/g.92970  ORF Transcript_47109/g.92970 Transcript_47109/m.92970 type:complete len:238 (+) Transcript_47109:187-900(+)|eukprot:Cvel_20118.t1-p1 / transcript=Cvel_20118.t1 / gene=Cvel_20118 / organism=Chromera_velia_CCMP2878 / gene_product=39S ribosomal protein L47, mitochondrial, putative / transcript_product=39S ribosomal protein L47, mitochondrial, putative / location=Cvel_scaffold1783:34679-38024(-) / protein_length=237 / sequence_SO=supercontig / SO=protein_coding / is_pseudo=false